MKVTGLKGDRIYTLKESKYLVDWDYQVSKPQKLVKDFLYRYWNRFVIGEEVCIPASKCRLDLVNFTRRIVIEVSPSSSHSFNSWMHKNRFKFGSFVQRELDKADWCEHNRFHYVELGDDDLANLSVELFRSLGVAL